MGRRRTRRVSRRAVQWIAMLAAADLLVFGLTLHTALTYSPDGGGSPSVMPLSELLGWVVTGVLLIVVLLVVKESRR